MMNRRARHSEEGSATLETLILTPILFALFGIAIYAGQVRMAHSMVRTAAQEAIRYAAIERTTYQAHFWSNGTAGAISASQGMPCNNQVLKWVGPDPYVTTTPGTPARVTISVSCDVPIRVVSFLGAARYITITETATAVVDTYKARR